MQESGAPPLKQQCSSSNLAALARSLEKLKASGKDLEERTIHKTTIQTHVVAAAAAVAEEEEEEEEEEKEEVGNGREGEKENEKTEERTGR
ncbi:hypothetical protein E2C01_052273 [Portunus trituberculatus]|uniref:Uncharacterized protein n=1 Tax=Portunus trituberculatus TaxID=210409 RepID=A0A5B7GM21_PORTR|nr:hypothetical protein [Portunus trituberculatus]